jgi:MFS family permease
VYITAESWLNDSSSNEDRGKALSLYMIVQTAGIVVAQYIVLLGDVSGYILFIIPSILVSLSFAPILLSVRPTPVVTTAKPMSIRGLIDASPLACFGLLLLGGVFAAQFGMFAIYGVKQDLTVPQISFMISTLYISAIVFQYPIGWLSDRMDRRVLIMVVAAVGGTSCFLPILFDGFFWILAASVMTGATTNPLYTLCIAYANDNLNREDMASAAGGLLFVNGVGAILGPVAVGWVLEEVGPEGYWWFVSALMLIIAGYAAWRMTRRATAKPVSDTVSYTPVAPSASPVAVEVAQEVYIEAELNELGDEVGGDSGPR